MLAVTKDYVFAAGNVVLSLKKYILKIFIQGIML